MKNGEIEWKQVTATYHGAHSTIQNTKLTSLNIKVYFVKLFLGAAHVQFHRSNKTFYWFSV